MKINKNSLIRLFVRLNSLIFKGSFQYPQSQKGRYNVANNLFEKLKWAYRHWYNQLEVAEKGSGLENYFKNQNLNFKTPDKFLAEDRISLSSAGDLLAVDILIPENTNNLFDDIQDYYSNADLVCANLESVVDIRKPVGRTQKTGQPAKMNTSLEMLQKFVTDGGINYFSTANNHSYDWGEDSLKATLNELDKIGSYYSGTNRTLKEQEDVLIIEINNIKIAMLSYTFDLNGNIIPDEKKYLVNEVRFNDESCDITMIKNHIARAKENGADIILAFCHWGWEFEMYPHKNIVEIAHLIIESGVDAILGNHPHVSQPMEKYTFERDGIIKEGLIVYSHGNFVSYHPKSKNSQLAYTIKFDIVKGNLNNDKYTFITNLKLLPIYILNENVKNNKYNCRLLKFKDVMNDIGENNMHKYNLSKIERDHLPHLNDMVLNKIILPKNHENLLA